MTISTFTGTGRAHAGFSPRESAIVQTAVHFSRRIFAAGLVQLRAWLSRPAERRLLASLSDHCLRDIGLSAEDVAEERNRLSLGQSIESIRHRGHL